MPIGMRDERRRSAIENRVRKKVGSARSARAGRTGLLRKIDWPRSPRSELAEEEHVLHGERPVEPEAGAQRRDVLPASRRGRA